MSHVRIQDEELEDNAGMTLAERGKREHKRALEALERAKAIEAERRKKGWIYKRVDEKTIIFTKPDRDIEEYRRLANYEPDNRNTTPPAGYDAEREKRFLARLGAPTFEDANDLGNYKARSGALDHLTFEGKVHYLCAIGMRQERVAEALDVEHREVSALRKAYAKRLCRNPKTPAQKQAETERILKRIRARIEEIKEDDLREDEVIFILRRGDGESFEDIAQAMLCGRSHVTEHFRRASSRCYARAKLEAKAERAKLKGRY